jgi:hypothetical protein
MRGENTFFLRAGMSRCNCINDNIRFLDGFQTVSEFIDLPRHDIIKVIIFFKFWTFVYCSKHFVISINFSAFNFFSPCQVLTENKQSTLFKIQEPHTQWLESPTDSVDSWLLTVSWIYHLRSNKRPGEKEASVSIKKEGNKSSLSSACRSLHTTAIPHI